MQFHLIQTQERHLFETFEESTNSESHLKHPVQRGALYARSLELNVVNFPEAWRWQWPPSLIQCSPWRWPPTWRWRTSRHFARWSRESQLLKCCFSSTDRCCWWLKNCLISILAQPMLGDKKSLAEVGVGDGDMVMLDRLVGSRLLRDLNLRCSRRRQTAPRTAARTGSAGAAAGNIVLLNCSAYVRGRPGCAMACLLHFPFYLTSLLFDITFV